MIRKKKQYKRPMKPFEKSRIAEENKLKEEYGLKNKKELWKAKAKVDYFRNRAKDLAKRPIEEQEILFNKLKALGLNTSNIAEVLDLKVENLLERRLPTVLTQKKLANKVKQARQMVVHKKILIHGNVVNSPGYLVPVAEENEISVKLKKKKPKVKESPVESTTEPSTDDKKEEVKEEPKEKQK